MAKHLFTTHSTYTGRGCAICGKTRLEHRLELAAEFGSFRVVIVREGNDAIDEAKGEGRGWSEGIATRYANAIEYLVGKYPELRISKVRVEFRFFSDEPWRRW